MALRHSEQGGSQHNQGDSSQRYDEVISHCRGIPEGRGTKQMVLTLSMKNSLKVITTLAKFDAVIHQKKTWNIERQGDSDVVGS